MFDIIVLIIIINVVLQVIKSRKGASGDTPVRRPEPQKKKASAQPNKPRTEKGFSGGFHIGQKKPEAASGRKTVPIQEKGQDIMQKVNQHIYGTDASTADLMLYKNYLEVERRTDIRKIARDMDCTMYQVIREIRDFQEMGYFRNVEIDDSDYIIRYTDSHEGGSMKGGEAQGTEASSAYETGKRQEKSGTDKRRSGKAGDNQAVKPRTKQPADIFETPHEEEGKKRGRAGENITYMTMPEQGPSIGYMTMTSDYTVGYMTMPEQGMEIHYNTMPETPEPEELHSPENL